MSFGVSIHDGQMCLHLRRWRLGEVHNGGSGVATRGGRRCGADGSRLGTVATMVMGGGGDSDERSCTEAARGRLSVERSWWWWGGGYWDGIKFSRVWMGGGRRLMRWTGVGTCLAGGGSGGGAPAASVFSQPGFHPLFPSTQVVGECWLVVVPVPRVQETASVAAVHVRRGQGRIRRRHRYGSFSAVVGLGRARVGWGWSKAVVTWCLRCRGVRVGGGDCCCRGGKSGWG